MQTITILMTAFLTEMISDLFINTTDPEIQANFHAPLAPIVQNIDDRLSIL